MLDYALKTPNIFSNLKHVFALYYLYNYNSY
jgi:hypothetical protein